MKHITVHFIRDLLLENNHTPRLEPVLSRLSKINIREDFHFPEHRHDRCEIIIPVSDKYECKLNSTILSAVPGELMFIQNGDLHEDFYHRDTELVFLIFDIFDFSGRKWNGGIFAEAETPTERVRKLEKDSALSKILDLLLESASGNGTAQAEKLAEAFFWQLSGTIAPELLSAPFKGIIEDNAFRHQISRFFMSHISGQLDVQELADSLSMSKRALEYKFRETFCSSPVQTFTAYKMKIAEQMLRQGASVKSAANELGFKDQFYFSTAFKRIRGISPSKLA